MGNNGSSQWLSYERRSEAIASGRQAAGGALGPWADGLFALLLNF